MDVTGGIGPRFARYLKYVMEGDSPLDHLPRMFHASEHFAGPFDESERALNHSFDRDAESCAADEWFIDKRRRSKRGKKRW
jgi:hypothetical protein